MIIKELTNEQFDKFINDHNYDSIYQSSSYAKVMQENGYKTLLVGLFDNSNNIIGESLILIENRQGFKYAIAPHGFVIDFNNYKLITQFTMCLKNYLKNKGIVALKINPKIIKNQYNSNKDIIYHNEKFDSIMKTLKDSGFYHFGFNSYFEAINPRFEASLKINKDYHNIFNDIKKGFKTKIRNADKNAIVIHKGNIDSLNDLYEETKNKYKYSEKLLNDIYIEFSKNSQASIYYAKVNTNNYLINAQKEYAIQEDLCEVLDQELINSNNKNLDLIAKKISADNLLNERKNKIRLATSLLKEYPNGIIIASIMVITNNDKVTLFVEGYDKKYQQFNAKHLLLWKVIEHYTKLGYKDFNLGGIVNIFDDSNKYKGLNEFKLSFNPIVNEYAGDFELICNSPLYFMYRNSLTLKKIIKK